MYFCINIVRKRILKEECPPQLLLLFLRNYLRSSPVQKEERDAWLLNYKSSYELPAIAEWRLPFWPSDMEKVIRPELSLNTYEQWLDMASTLKISEDLIRVIVLKQVSDMLELPSDISADSEWCLDGLDETIISQIQNCAEGIINQELACAGLFRMFRLIKRGVAKSQLAKLCCEFAEKWANTAKTSEAVNTLENVKQMYCDIYTTNILYKYGLGESCYLNKTSRPDILIKELYDHPDIVKTNQYLNVHCPDINSAVNEIAEVHNETDLKELLLNLLKEWLASADSINDKFDDTVTIQGNLQMLHDSQNETEKLIRASYLLNNRDSNSLLRTLLDIIFSDEKEGHTKFKLNALICVMSTKSMKNISNICGKTSENIRHHLQTLHFICDLESLGYIKTVSQFEHCKKHDLVMELINSSQKSAPILSLTAEIALKYRIFDGEIWEELLKHMVQGKMYEGLEDILGKVPANTPGIVEAWTCVLFVPFRLCNAPLSDEQRKMCVHSLKLLHKCQVTDRIDLLQMAQQCCQLDSPELAAMLLHFMSRYQREIIKKKILCSISINEIMLKLEDIEDHYKLSRIKAILEETIV